MYYMFITIERTSYSLYTLFTLFLHSLYTKLLLTTWLAPQFVPTAAVIYTYLPSLGTTTNPLPFVL